MPTAERSGMPAGWEHRRGWRTDGTVAVGSWPLAGGNGCAVDAPDIRPPSGPVSPASMPADVSAATVAIASHSAAQRGSARDDATALRRAFHLFLLGATLL